MGTPLSETVQDTPEESKTPSPPLTGRAEAGAEPDGTPGKESPPSVRKWAAIFLGGLIICGAALQFPLLFKISITGDELRFLSDVHTYLRGELTESLLTLHVHFFGWLAAVTPNPLNQVIAGRVVYYILFLGTLGFMYLIARRFLSSPAALFAVLCFLAFREVILTAGSFRFDGLSVFFLMAALTLLLYDQPQRGSSIVAAFFITLALLVTPKSVFYLPTFAVVALLRQESGSWSRRFRSLAELALALAIIFPVVFGLHAMTLAGASPSEAAVTAQNVGDKAFILDRLFPTRRLLVGTLALNALIWLYLIFGVVALLRRLGDPARRREALLMLSLVLPLGSLAIYRNAFAYYFVFLMPAVLVVAGVRFDEVMDRAQQGRQRIAVPFLLLMVLGAALSAGVHHRGLRSHDMVAKGRLAGQRQLVDAVLRMFPEPVPYVDARSMIASYPKVGFFMSGWGFENYRDAGRPIFPVLLRERQPQFLISNHDALVLDETWETEGDAYPEDRLFREDIESLRDNFVPHWGSVYVVGKHLRLNANDSAAFEIVVPGPYTVEGKSAILIDGLRRDPGEVLTLERGQHMVRSRDTQAVVLRWGNHLYRPSEPALLRWRTHGARPDPDPTPSETADGA